MHIVLARFWPCASLDQRPAQQHAAQMFRMENTCGGLHKKHVERNGAVTLPLGAIAVAVQVSLTRVQSSNSDRCLSAFFRALASLTKMFF